MKKLIAGVVFSLATVGAAHAGVAFFKYSYVDGLNRICVYDHLGSKYIITIPAAQVCPVTLKV